MMCGPRPPTPGDLEAVAEFGRFLEAQADAKVAEVLAAGRIPCPVEVAGGLVGCEDAEPCEFANLCESVVTR